MKYLINPFERIAGWQALVIGFTAMALTAVIGKINNVAFDGVLDVHSGAQFSFSVSFAMQTINFITLFLTMWLSGVCFSKTKFRAIDVAGTMALSRIPMLLLAIVCFLPITPESIFDIPRLAIFIAVCIPFIAWTIALMYNAFVVSCNMRGVRAVVSFIAALFVAEAASKIIIILLMGSVFAVMPINKAFSSGNSNTGENIVAADTLTIRQKTENVVEAFENGDFAAVTVYFDANMKRALPPAGLRLAWNQTVATCGRYEKADIEALTETRIENFDVIEVPFFFARERRNLRLAFNQDGEIGGLFFLPVN